MPTVVAEEEGVEKDVLHFEAQDLTIVAVDGISNEITRLTVRRSDCVRRLQEKIWKDIGIPVEGQLLELGAILLEGSMTWTEFSFLRNVGTVLLSDLRRLGASSHWVALRAVSNGFEDKNDLDFWGTPWPFSRWTGITYQETEKELQIDLIGKRLRGFISTKIGNLRMLTFLRISLNNISGIIPREIGSLCNLKKLDFSGNSLTGSIPREMGLLRLLLELNLSYNELTGEIPPEIGNLKQLIILNMSNNKLSCTIPCEIGNLSNLQQLLLSDNEICGHVPFNLGKLTSLVRLALQDNHLERGPQVEFDGEQLTSFLGELSDQSSVVESWERVMEFSVVDWSGEERARVAVRGSDRVSLGQEQICEQTGVRVGDQRLVLGDMELYGAMFWGRFPSLRDGSTVQLTVVTDQVNLAKSIWQTM
jgi:hypothetical protein